VNERRSRGGGAGTEYLRSYVDHLSHLRRAGAFSVALVCLGVKRILVTGMSGTGKSTVLAGLARRGHRVVDTDYDGWSENVPLPDGSGREQLWREDLMSALLAQDSDGPLFVSGCASNQSTFYDRFDAVVLLTAPTDVLLERLATRTTNPFGKDPAERDRILKDVATVEPWLRRTATVELSTERPVQDVVEAVEALARRSSRS
jgi:shikimate kinase